MEVIAAKSPKSNQFLIYACILAFLANLDDADSSWHSKRFCTHMNKSYCAAIAAFLAFVFIGAGRAAQVVAATPQ